ncbi:TetR/AcrR family transcriptional regulator [Algisphaera agarilytica]|uniref:TetR/AcrR family transcriptional repressor of nem operon n=1 Tax=Algisphaera agarilytica TaxID=1385975 RepID=A0A7X0H7L7_9BACT|nr:TetR/AcrR family transcriptional regulator [Algisphaera agarilytica]MBB6430537.1 TetR/AcrR family transcriptional repressor of nem operon [Algisphaera agarilytica]
MREKVLDAAEQMVQERGLSAVSFQQLADAVGLSKPSVFHHFPNKQALAKALVDRCQSKYGVEYGRVIDADLPAPDKLWGIVDIFEQGLRDDRLCLLGSLSQSLSSLNEAVSEDLRLSVSRSIERYATVFEQGVEEGTLRIHASPADTAAAFLALLEGLQVLARAKRDHAMFRNAAGAFVQAMLV